MDKKKEEKEAYATDDPTETSAEKQEEMAKEAIKKFKSLQLVVPFYFQYSF